MTAEQLEASRAERMRQNGHGAITIEDVRTWIEETGLCIFLPRSAQAGFTAPTFVEAVAGQRTTEPTLELISTAESLLVRLEDEGVAVRLNLAGQPGDQPDYVVAGWVLPYIYALRGDRDWRRSPQLTGSRQVSPLAVQAAKQIDTGNQTAMQIRDALGREVTETAVLRALHELWKQLRIIPVVAEVGAPALWQPLRQRFQKAIAEGASTSQVTAISVLASIYLQAVVAASMEDIEMFLSPLTSRSKIREVVRGLAATRQVHTTNMGSSPLFYVAGTLPEFPVAPSFQISASYPPYRGSSYLGLDHDLHDHEDVIEPAPRRTNHFEKAVQVQASASIENSPKPFPSHDHSPALAAESTDFLLPLISEIEVEPLTARQKPLVDRAHRTKRPVGDSATVTANPTTKSSAPPRSRTPRSSTPTRNGAGRATTPAPRNRNASSSAELRPTSGPRSTSGSRNAASGDRRRAPAPRSTSSNGAAPRTTPGAKSSSAKPANPRSVNARGTAVRSSSPARSTSGHAAPNDNSQATFGKSNGNGVHKNGGNKNGTAKSDSRHSDNNGHSSHSKNASAGVTDGARSQSRSQSKVHSSSQARPQSRSDVRPNGRKGTTASGSAAHNGSGFKPNKPSVNGTKPKSNSRSSEDREPTKASATKRYSFSGQAPKALSSRTSKPSKVGTKSATGAKRSSGSARSAEAKRRG